MCPRPRSFRRPPPAVLRRLVSMGAGERRAAWLMPSVPAEAPLTNYILEDPEARLRFSFLFAGFESRYWWWEVMIMLRKQVRETAPGQRPSV